MARWGLRSVAGLPLLALALSITAAGWSQARPADVRMAFVSLSGHTLPLWVGVDEHLFERQGVNPHVLYIAGSVIATAALLSGDLDIIQETPAASVRAQLKGADTVVLASHIPYSDHVLVGAPGIHSLADLRGKTVGVTKAGTVSDEIARIVLTKEGLVPGRDVQLANFGTQPAQVAALQNGLVQAISVSPPNQLIAEKAGGHEILDTAKLHIPYPMDGIVTTRRFAGAHPETLQAFLRAWLQAIQFIRTHPARAQAVLGMHTHESDPQILRLSYHSLVNILPAIPVPQAAEIQTALSLIPEGKGRNPADFFDPGPIQQAVRALGRGAGP